MNRVDRIFFTNVIKMSIFLKLLMEIFDHSLILIRKKNEKSMI